MEGPGMKDVSNQFRDHLECPICFEIYNFPKLLPCQHTFCEHCLRGIIMDEVATHTVQGVHKLSFSCPVCRQETLPPQIDHSPDEWASMFPTNLLAASLIESMPSLKDREDNYPRQQRSLPGSNSIMGASQITIPELPLREYRQQEGISLLEGIPPSFEEITDFDSIVGIARCVKEGCLELKHTEKANLEKLEVLKSIRDQTSEEDCQLESLRSEIMTRLSELNILEDAICTTEMLVETYFLEGEEQLEASSERMAIRSQLAEYENQLHRLSKRSREVPVNNVLDSLKTIPLKSTGGDKNVEHETEQAQSTSFMPIAENMPAQQQHGTWIPGLYTMNQYPVMMFYPHQPAFTQPSAPCSSLHPVTNESSNADAINQMSGGVKGTKRKTSKWRKFFQK